MQKPGIVHQRAQILKYFPLRTKKKMVIFSLKTLWSVNLIFPHRASVNEFYECLQKW